MIVDGKEGIIVKGQNYVAKRTFGDYKISSFIEDNEKTLEKAFEKSGRYSAGSVNIEVVIAKERIELSLVRFRPGRQPGFEFAGPIFEDAGVEGIYVLFRRSEKARLIL